MLPPDLPEHLQEEIKKNKEDKDRVKLVRKSRKPVVTIVTWSHSISINLVGIVDRGVWGKGEFGSSGGVGGAEKLLSKVKVGGGGWYERITVTV